MLPKKLLRNNILYEKPESSKFCPFLRGGLVADRCSHKTGKIVLININSRRDRKTRLFGFLRLGRDKTVKTLVFSRSLDTFEVNVEL